MTGRLKTEWLKWAVLLVVVVLCGSALSSQATRAAAHQVGVPVVPVVDSAADPTSVILSYLDHERADDPLIQVGNHIWIKASNVNGVVIGGQTFYYRLSPDASFDPVSRGAADPRDLVIWQVIHAEDSQIVIIYTLGPAARHQL